MGMMNYAVNRLLERKEIFADLVNGMLFEGKELLRPERMELLSPKSGSLYRDEKGKMKVKEFDGDIRMKANEELYSLIVAAEPQDKVHYAMPVRMMEYIAMEYRKQIQDIEKMNREKPNKEQIITSAEYISGIYKGDKLTPVIGFILYCNGDEEWDGHRSLYEMMDWGEDEESFLAIRTYWEDFKINVINISEFGKCEFFKSNLQHISEMIKYSKDKRKLKEYMDSHRNELNKMDSVETTAVFALLGQTKMVERLLIDRKENGEEDVKMCLALDEMMKDSEMIGEARGIEQGIEQGIANMNELVRRLISVGRMEDFVRSTTDMEFQKSLFAEFGIHS